MSGDIYDNGATWLFSIHNTSGPNGERADAEIYEECGIVRCRWVGWGKARSTDFRFQNDGKASVTCSCGTVTVGGDGVAVGCLIHTGLT